VADEDQPSDPSDPSTSSPDATAPPERATRPSDPADRLLAAPDPFGPAKLGPVELRNRVIKAATFEGVMPDALVTDELIDYHTRVEGIGMTTVAYLAVAPEGRTHAETIWLREEAAPGLARLADAVHSTGTAISGQMGHAGPVANAGSNKMPGLAPGRIPNPLAMKVTRPVTEDDLTRIRHDFERGARLLADVGFDSVELHLGHDYLPSSFISPRFNRRKDKRGGSLEQRTSWPREIVRAVKEAVGDRVAVTAKITMHDGVPGGLRPAESLRFAQMLEAEGCLDALELTAGSSLGNPMFLFRGDAPREAFAETMKAPQKWGFKLLGGTAFKEYPFEEAFLKEMALEFRAGLSMPIILLGGINRLDTIERAMSDGFEFVAMGRALLHEPDLVARMQAGAAVSGGCIHCNLCMPSIYSGTRCVLTHPEPIEAGTPVD